MATPVPSRPVVRFGNFEVDLEAGELRQKGTQIKIQDQPLRILGALLERPGEVVTREQLSERLWPSDTFVDFEHSLNSAIKKLRQALQDDPDRPVFIETLPKRGYRFIAPMRVLAEAAEASLGVEELEGRDGGNAGVEPLKTQTRTFGIAWVIGIVAVLGVLIAVATTYLTSRRAPIGSVASTGKIMLAVLPFENYSAEAEQEYLADGLTEEMITQLGSMDPERLGIIARTSAMKYKGARVGVDQIGKELGVAYVLEGSIRTEADRVRVTAQLIRVRDQTHLWARSYERSRGGILTMQQEVANAIANEIQVELTPQYQQRVATLQFADPRAHEAYARGRFFWNKRTDADLATSIQYFEEVLRYEPRYALAYSGLADAYFYRSYAWGSLKPREGMPKAKAAATKALELDPNLAEAHTSMALVKLFYEWDWPAAEAEFKRAIELNPNYPTAHHGYAVLLMTVYGRKDEAIEEANRALELDPLSIPLNNIVALLLSDAGRSDETIERAGKLHELNPKMAEPYGYMSSAYEAKGSFNQAVEASLKAHELAGTSAQSLARVREAYAKSGIAGYRRSDAEMTLEQAQQQPPQTVLGQLALASAYAQVGNDSATLDILEKIADERSGMAVWTKLGYSRFETIRSNPRFQALLRRIGLPQ
jgi:TolB-like protein/DNA-binding winged helix-turn-helix (wHTH) protein/Flp pilus assembly protein TadD